MRIKRRKSDILYSRYIRTKANWRCARCGRQQEENSRGLHASHFWGRSKESVRFDDDNVDAHCYGCHSYFEQHPQEFREWKLKQLGKKRFKELEVRAHTYKKRDDKMDTLKAQLLLESL